MVVHGLRKQWDARVAETVCRLDAVWLYMVCVRVACGEEFNQRPKPPPRAVAPIPGLVRTGTQGGPVGYAPVSYTHLTLPTIYSV